MRVTSKGKICRAENAVTMDNKIYGKIINGIFFGAEGAKHVFYRKNEYNDIREKSFLQWLDEMEKHDDVAVRCGVKLAREYMQYLKDENEKLREENQLKNSYLKKMKITNK